MRRSFLQGLSTGLIEGNERLRKLKAEERIKKELERKRELAKREAIKQEQLKSDQKFNKEKVLDAKKKQEKADETDLYFEKEDYKSRKDLEEHKAKSEIDLKKQEEILKLKKKLNPDKGSDKDKKEPKSFDDLNYNDLTNRIYDLEYELNSVIYNLDEKRRILSKKESLTSDERIRVGQLKKTLERAKTARDKKNFVRPKLKIEGYEKLGNK